jgi:glycosyltransferase involved in cell wall biosynthesis
MEPGRPLRLALDAGPLLGDRTGVGHLTARLFDELARRPDVDVRGFVISRTGRRDVAALLPAGVTAGTSPLPARVAHACWARVAWPTVELWTGRVDVVHSPNFVAPPARAPVIVSVHDVAFVHSPGLCRPEAAALVPLLRRAIARGVVIHTGSDFVAAEIRDLFDLPAERVVRVYSGIAGTPIAGDPASGRALAGGDRYVLALGTVEPRKGLPGLVRAFDALAADEPDARLVVAGADGWGVDAYDAAVAAARHADRIVRLGYVSERQRVDLLAGAAALAYPSLYEGFGHPPFEAMRAGVPVVTTRAGSLPEVVGDAALFVDVGDDDALAGALQRVLTDDALRADLVVRGHGRVEQFPWSRATGDFVALYRQVAAEGGAPERAAS